jgi:FkbM family methyltransferase
MKLNRLTNLDRLPARYRPELLSYFLKKTMGLYPGGTEPDINEYYRTLINSNGRYITETGTDFLSAFQFNNKRFVASLRKWPTSDFNVFKEIFETEMYKPLIDLVLKHTSDKVAGRKLTVLDAGANVGFFTIYFNLYFPGSETVAVEPDLKNCYYISKNISDNPGINASVLQGGLWKSDSFLQIKTDYRDGLEWSYRVEETDKDTGLKGYTIKTILQRKNWSTLDVLKMDIEGSEKAVFGERQAALEFLSKTRFVAIEIHDELADRTAINSLLEEAGFDFFDDSYNTFGINRNLL